MIKGEHIVIDRFNKSEKAVIDSRKKYHLTELADSCLKFYYVANCMEQANDSSWCKGNLLTVGEGAVRLTWFINKGLDKKQIHFEVFLNDSLPCSMELKAIAGFPIGFTVSVKKKKNSRRNGWRVYENVFKGL